MNSGEALLQDDGFHEIQLSGKQLVFLCMATTVVSVLIFLCGVLVGRGVRAEKVAAQSVEMPAADQAVAGGVPVDPPPADAPAPITSDEPPPPVSEAAEPNRGETPPPASQAPPERTPAPEPVPQPAMKTATAAPAPGASAPAGRASGFMVQVASLRDRAEADAMVKRLSRKGYPAFMLEPAAGAPATVFRVRIGGYPTRREAEDIKKKLEKEEQFSPWITR